MSAPTVRRRRLGGKLRELRGPLTLDEVAEKSGGKFGAHKLSRLETAKVAAKRQDIEDLLSLYADLGRDVDDELRAALVALTREGSQRGWWHSYRGVLSPVYEDLISLEAEATSAKAWQLGVIPGLLQPSEYARQIIKATAMSDGADAKVDALVEVRLARQAVLTREKPLKLSAVIAEAALRTRTADPAVMDEQLGRLLTMGRRPNIDIQVLRSDAPPHVGQLSGFCLLRFDDHDDLDVVHTEALTAALYVEQREQVSVYRDAALLVAAAAESVEKSAEMITEIRRAL
ncbi:helix-turn-helix transcriptional regulator [Streptomyces polychromogenes]|uniref:Helix-turn-helix transcriptional regulator n=1 Tax=Streptomyces polychromogenes TaxID=67342 RepID=A0ABN0VJN6_9ACTN